MITLNQWLWGFLLAFVMLAGPVEIGYAWKNYEGLACGNLPYSSVNRPTSESCCQHSTDMSSCVSGCTSAMNGCTEDGNPWLPCQEGIYNVCYVNCAARWEGASGGACNY